MILLAQFELRDMLDAGVGLGHSPRLHQDAWQALLARIRGMDLFCCGLVSGLSHLEMLNKCSKPYISIHMYMYM